MSAFSTEPIIPPALEMPFLGRVDVFRSGALSDDSRVGATVEGILSFAPEGIRVYRPTQPNAAGPAARSGGHDDDADNDAGAPSSLLLLFCVSYDGISLHALHGHPVRFAAQGAVYCQVDPSAVLTAPTSVFEMISGAGSCEEDDDDVCSPDFEMLLTSSERTPQNLFDLLTARIQSGFGAMTDGISALESNFVGMAGRKRRRDDDCETNEEEGNR